MLFCGGVRMFNKGQEVTTVNLTDFFKKLYYTINNLTNKELSQLTSGQFMTDTTDGTNAVIYDPLNVYSIQYFSKDVLIHGDDEMKISQYYEDQVTKIIGGS